jgi:pyridinium-3,5-bisthiocarboxylic acid mononucleotide nickel chelatase
MGKLLLFDAFNGVSGDMILGAMIDLGLPLDYLERHLASLKIDAFVCTAEKIKRRGILGTDFRVEISESLEPVGRHGSHGEHSHHHRAGHHRSYAEVREVIRRADLGDGVKQRALAIFRRLAEAEAKVHGMPIDEVHFHEVGAVDSIVDIVGACVGFDYFEIQEFYTLPLNLGGGNVTFSHGTWPVPAPATAELVRGFAVSVSEVQAELTTPTGAAIVTTLSSRDRKLPDFELIQAGFGAGDRELPGIPNMLRLILGERAEMGSISLPSDLVAETVVLLEANIDDMDPEMFGYFMESALNEGALDVFFVSAQMKKNRPGQLVTVLCRPPERNRMLELLFQETTTLGVRISSVDRCSLERETIEVESEFGSVRCKVSRRQGEVMDVSPEFEDLKRIAHETGLPLRVIRRKLFERLTELEIWERSSI